MEKFVTRAFNKMEVDENFGVIRKISQTDRLKDEINYYRTLPVRLGQLFFPRLIDYKTVYTTDANYYYMDLELYSYPNLGEYIFDPDLEADWDKVFTKIQTILHMFQTYKPMFAQTHSPEFYRECALDMYINKTEKEYDKFVEGWSDKLPHLFTTDVLQVNDDARLNFHIIWPSVKEYIVENMLDYKPTAIHGDCCFSNILYGHEKGVIRFIDPRGSFGAGSDAKGVWGDIRYDIAKLYHSVDGAYEAIINDHFEVEGANFAGGKVKIIDPKYTMYKAKRAFEAAFFPQFNKKEILILTGTIFIGMCARHYDSLSRQHAMYLTGIRLLNEAMAL